MSDLLILGTDTDAGKTTFAVAWLAAFAERYEYWKPLESGASDSHEVQRRLPGATVHAPLHRFTAAVAPLLAARQEGSAVPTAQAIALARPQPQRGRFLLVETFGSPLSPLNEEELQIALVRALNMATVLVTLATVGAIGRCLQCLQALAVHGIEPRAVVLLGQHDPFAVEQIGKHGKPGRVWCLTGQAEDRLALEGLLQSLDVAAPTRMADWQERDRHAVWHPYTSLGDPDAPLVCTGAQDEFLHLADGRPIIDAISSWWTILHGHRHPALMAALDQAAQSFDHVHFAGITHAPAVALAELMLATMPWPGGRVFFSDNGSTAVEVALKLTYQFWCHQGQPGRTRFIAFEGGYHGDTFGAMAVSRDPVFFGRFEPLLFETSIVGLDADALAAELERQRGKVAAVIVEPLVQGAGGMRMHSPQQLAALFATAREHGVLFIADEVMTGRRTGTLWAHQAAGIAPDLVCAGKTLAGGVLPLAATVVAPQIVEAWQTEDRGKTFFHGHSFTAHPLACAVAVANWQLPQPSAAPMEAFWHESLEPLRRLPQVREVRIRGTIAAVELAIGGGYLAGVGRQLRQICLEHGVLCRPLGNVLYALPPLLTRHASLARVADAMHAAVRSVG